MSKSESDEDYSIVYKKKKKKVGRPKSYKKKGKFKGIENIFQTLIDGSLEGRHGESSSTGKGIRKSNRKRKPVVRDEFTLDASFVDETLDEKFEYNSRIYKSQEPTTPVTSLNNDQNSEDEIQFIGSKIRKKFTPKRQLEYIPKQYEYKSYKC